MNGLSHDYRLNREDGSTVSLPRLTTQNRTRYVQAFRDTRRAWVMQNAVISGLDGKELAEALNRHDAKKLPYHDALQWFVDDPAGRYNAVLLAVHQQDPSAGEQAAVDRLNALNLDDEELLDAAAGVLNVELTTAPEKAGKPTPFAESQPSETSSPKQAGSPTGTGSTTPSSSPATLQTA